MVDINGVVIKPGDIVETRQQPGGILPPADTTRGVVEGTIDSFYRETLRIRYRAKGRAKGRGFDQFILLEGQINEITERPGVPDVLAL